MVTDLHTEPRSAPAILGTAATHHMLRLRLKPKGAPTGYVDGGWWPRSRDLVAELPALVEVLAVRLGSVTRVAFALSEWRGVPRRVTIDGRVVQLEGFRTQDERLLSVVGPDSRRISLLVVPPEATEAAGHDALMTASRRGNADRPAELLAASKALPTTAAPNARHRRDDTEDGWESEGGHFYEQARNS